MRGTKATGRGDAQGQLVQSQEMLSEMVLPASPCPHCLSREQEIINRGRCVREWLTRDKATALKLQANQEGQTLYFSEAASFPSLTFICFSMLQVQCPMCTLGSSCPLKYYDTCGEEF